MRTWTKQAIGLTALLFCMLFSLSAWAAPKIAPGQRVFDEAGLFTDAETRKMENTIAELQETMKMDVVIVTTTDSGGKSSQRYADDFYEAGGFGTRKDYSGVLFLIDMDNRELSISTEGVMIRFLTDVRIERMLDHVYEKAGQEQYADAATVFLNDTFSYYRQGIPGGQYNYDTETGKISRYRSITVIEVLMAIVVSLAAASLACLNVKREYAMKAQKRQAGNYNMAYRANAMFAFHNQNDRMVNSFVSQRVRPRSTSSGGGGGGSSSSGRSSTHRSSSGRSHGGGSRKF